MQDTHLWVGLTPLQRSSQCILQPQPTGQYGLGSGSHARNSCKTFSAVHSTGHPNCFYTNHLDSQSVCNEQFTVATLSGQIRFFYGIQKHNRSRCFARNLISKNYKKKGNFARVCRTPTAAAFNYNESLLASSAPSFNFLESLFHLTMWGKIKCKPMRILDTGSSENFIHPDMIKRLRLAVKF